MKELVLPHERVDDLERNGLRIIQNPMAFRFGMDAVLLADFTQVRPREQVADMGTGTGILPILLSQKQATAKFHAFEIQQDMADMASRSMRFNGLQERIQIHGMDMREAHHILGHGKTDAVVCNPPYGKKGGALVNPAESLMLARHEADTEIGDIIEVSAALLRNGGRLTMVFPTTRMLELCDILRQKRMEPKRIRMVCAKVNRAPYLVLVEAMKNARPYLKWMPPLVVYEEDGQETAELRRIYHKG